MTYTDLVERVIATYGKKRLLLIFLVVLGLTNELVITGTSIPPDTVETFQALIKVTREEEIVQN